MFYIQKTATEFWNNTTLKHHLKSNMYQRQGKLTHNFQTTLSENSFRQKALMAFKDKMLLDFINIKKLIMALGSEFSFIGNQHRLIIEDEEYFIDLLFFNIINPRTLNFRSMESKLHENLYFAREIINIDAISGGFNFQNAWTSGFILADSL